MQLGFPGLLKSMALRRQTALCLYGRQAVSRQLINMAARAHSVRAIRNGDQEAGARIR